MLKDKKVLITGANGFIGRSLVADLVARDARVATMDVAPLEGGDGREITAYTGDLEDRTFVEDCIGRCRPDVVFHLAAFKERSSAMADFYKAVGVNVLGSLNLFSALNARGNVSSVVVLGTAEEYGRNDSPFREGMREGPVTAYSYSKLCLTNLCEILYNLHGLPVVVLRPTLAYGPGQDTGMFLPSLIESLIGDRPFLMTAGEQTRDYVYITDLVDAMIKASETPEAQGEIINIGSGTAVRLLDLVEMVERLLGKKGRVTVGGREYRPDEIMDYQVDTSKAKRLLRWEPKVSLDEGVELTVRSFFP